MGTDLSLSIGAWLIAILPMLLMMLMLVVLQWSAVKAALISLIIGLITGIFYFKLPLYGLFVSLGQGAWDTIEIIMVIWTALLFYQVCKHAGAFEAIKEGITNKSTNHLYLILMFGWVFASLLQGVSGFGAPIAIVAPLLVGIGVKPAFAVIIALTSTAWSNLFGSLGIAWSTTLGLVNIENEALTLLYTTILLFVSDIIGGFFVAWIYGRWQAIKEGLPIILTISVIHGLGQILVAQFNTEMAAVLPAILAMGAMILFARIDFYQEPSEEITVTNSPIMQDDFDNDDGGEENTGKLTINQAFVPFYLLIAISLIMLGIPSIANYIEQFQISLLSYDNFSTGYNFVTEGSQAYSPIAPLTSPGFYLLISSIAAWLWYRHHGSYQDKENLGKQVTQGVVDDAITPTLTTLLFLMLSQLLVNSGQNAVIAMGIASVSSPIVYAGLSPWIGTFSSFMTSSTTSGNILFVPIHNSVVQSMPQLSLNQMIANQSAASSVGNCIGPSNVVLGASTAKAEDQTGVIYKWGIIYTVLVNIAFTVIAIIMHLFFPH
ncbi:L-lactate permease [Aerococcus urinae]|uniref:L-lactate permease n=1 Tax=Aerococcus urinae TaxID=1376 RepID=UPI00227B3907|nr:L-lactate permease [Aerococcus urinae]MCY3038175.1 L-lactate permease [Aerococcus urinae]